MGAEGVGVAMQQVEFDFITYLLYPGQVHGDVIHPFENPLSCHPMSVRLLEMVSDV